MLEAQIESVEGTLEGAVPAWETGRRWCAHLLCFVMPGLTLAFLVTGPHASGWALLWLLPIPALVHLDGRSRPELRQPPAALPAWPFDALLYVLVALQLANVALGAARVGAPGSSLPNALVAAVLLGVSSGWSALVVAHELIHRRERHRQLLGRVLLWTVLYDHFAVEHVRGHHARVGTDEDPATARFGETYGDFWRRTVPAQFRSAWRLEARRLGDEAMALRDPRSLRNTVLHGVLAELCLAALVAALFGPAALAVFVLQAWVAVRLLEAVNYFEHWGLRRTGRKVRPVDSWDTDSWFTLHALVGLSRHADHHAFASRPYAQLRRWDASPKLPRGYLGMVVLVMFQNARCRALLTAELERKRLGPFAQPGS